jgi:murein DD-endopeptidase MepM/ murein hydrolase activator NlpD
MLTRAMAFLFLFAAPAGAFEIGLPIACKIETDCFIQQYPDRDPGPAAKDYACGSATYDGHDGTDIRVKTLADVERGIAVIASAPGVVKATRDGVTDHLVKDDADRVTVKDRECGNGVVINHGDGWETQYCHMKRGSLVVAKGAEVAAGDRLGEVGYSGLAQFPHVHLTVRRNGKALDPFAPDGSGSSCGMAADTIWSAASKDQLTYSGGDLIELGFAGKAIALDEIAAGPVPPPHAKSPAMVAYAWAINLREGDHITVTLFGPNGELASNAATLERNKAQYFLFAGKKLKAASWPPGTYTARFVVTRDSASFISRSEVLELR